MFGDDPLNAGGGRRKQDAALHNKADEMARNRLEQSGRRLSTTERWAWGIGLLVFVLVAFAWMSGWFDLIGF